MEETCSDHAKSFSSLLQHFLDKLADWRLIHPLGAVDEGVTIFIRPLGSAVAARHFVFRDVNTEAIGSFVAGSEDTLVRDLPFTREQPVERELRDVGMR